MPIYLEASVGGRYADSRSRYLHVQILLFRPVLANVCLKLNPNASTQLITSGVISQTLDEKCAEICFEAAHEVINLFYEHINLDNVTGPVPAWWFAVLCECAYVSS